MGVPGRRALAILGGMVFGFAVGASATVVVSASAESGLAGGGLAAGFGLGLMVAATIRE